MTVTELTKYIKRRLETDDLLNNLLITGEISNFHHHSSGHMYFTLKDDNSRLKSVMFRSANQNLKFQPEDGMEVIASGYVSLYESRGQYQLYVQDLQPEGIGALHIAFEQLKEELQKKGLFAVEHKQELPQFPQKVGVITSPTGAAIRDILSVIQRRFRGVSVLVAPATVQGDKAASTLVGALEILNQQSDVDVIIIGRGGGSIEDLWPFNEEEVARAIFSSQTPVVSAVGHETDYTISDFVADVRAPTPSAAGELVVSNQKEVNRYVKGLTDSLVQNIEQKLSDCRNQLVNLMERRVFLQPKRQLKDRKQRIDELEERLINLMERRLNLAQERLQSKAGKLDTLSPLNILSRGYSYCRKRDKKESLSSVSEIKPGDKLEIFLSDGKLEIEVMNIKKGKVNIDQFTK
ncbi:exodeoxyribonuclease VII, large subunit [Acetohalobium arabaticum DSM 5501]|uniref:Exodeoxyribonuclease 7 large subunit n=2 Tax=Acetohalobium TaxID=28186 RepID=D9QRV0_ACEAZ|nr:exodeoxyribonuclease VII, large subunit [Acetohalobium arabaticum DSM 5501]